MTVDWEIPTPRPGPQTEPIDQAVLEQLRLDLDDEDGSAVADLVTMYVASSRTLIPDLTAALRSGDTVAAAHCAHALASPTTLVGANPLGALLKRVRDCANDTRAQPAELSALADVIGSEGDRVLTTLVELGLADRVGPH